MNTWTSGQSEATTAAKAAGTTLQEKTVPTWKFWHKERGTTKEQIQSDVEETDEEATDSVVSQDSRQNNTETLFWPHKLLPSVIPQSRIYTWGYDVDVNHLFSSASQATVFQHAGSLLSDLADERILDEHVSYFILLGLLTVYFY